MEQTDHAGRHGHPETFDEVIARGFPGGQMETLAKSHVGRANERPAIRTAPLSLTNAVVGATTREDQAALSPEKQVAFRNAIDQLVADGKYLALIQVHMNMSHNMHGTMGEVGLYRFLPWHRRYLVEFEQELQRVDKVLRPGVTEDLGIPYWRWQDPFPTWLVNFLPANDPIRGIPPQPRKNASPPDKANRDDFDIIVNHFLIQNTGLTGENEYTKFTYGIEGWGRRPDGTKLPAHNHGHSWIGGIMNNTRTSPTDPMFWLHHAEVDRLWQIWRQANSTPTPGLTGAQRIMDPWVESYDDLTEISALGYAYDSMSL